MVNFSLEGKIALVTGASYGIGFGIASAYAEAGATICFNDLSQEKVDKGIAAYKEIGVDAHGYVCDVTDEAQVQAMVAKINEEVGIIDILVNNAGIIMRKPMLEMEADEFRKVIDVDLNAPFIVSKAVIPGMKEKGHGKIITNPERIQNQFIEIQEMTEIFVEHHGFAIGSLRDISEPLRRLETGC